MAVCICRECGARVVTRSRFEVDCTECGGELVEEDVYDEEPGELVCVDCGYRIQGGGPGRTTDDDFYEGRLSVDDPCPRCEGVLDSDSGRRRTVREQPEYKVAKAAARNLVAKHRLSGPKIDVETLAIAEGLKVLRGRFAHEGMLNGDVIEVPEDESEAAQRFVIAHELGHSHLRHQVADDRIEAEANAFAAELVIPTSALREVVKGGPAAPRALPAIRGEPRGDGVRTNERAVDEPGAAELVPPGPRQSRWRDDETWQARLAADEAALHARLSDEQKEVLDGVAEAVGAGDPTDVLRLDFLVVFGSYARGNHGPDSDLDVYFEAANLPEPYNRIDVNRHYQVFGMPRGALVDDLRARRPFGPPLARDALVVHDQGRFRQALIAFDEGAFS